MAGVSLGGPGTTLTRRRGRGHYPSYLVAHRADPALPGGGGGNIVVSRLTDFQSQHANVRARAFLELVVRGEEILGDLKEAILSFDLPDRDACFDPRFQYLSHLFTLLPVDPDTKSETARREFIPAGKHLLLWEACRLRIQRELTYLAVREGEALGIQDLFKRVIRERRFGQIFHQEIMDSLSAMNNETVVGMFLGPLTDKDLPEYMLGLVCSALGTMICQNVTGEQKRKLGIQQLGDMIPEKFLRSRPRPEEPPIDLRYADQINAFEEDLVRRSRLPKPELLELIVNRMTQFILEHGGDESYFRACLRLLDVFGEKAIFVQLVPEFYPALRGIASDSGDDGINIVVKSRARLILRDLLDR